MAKCLLKVVGGGVEFLVDTSDEACLRFGFRHTDRIIDPDGDSGTVIGAGLVDGGDSEREVMWYTTDAKGFFEEGEVYYWITEETDLRNKGFKLIGGPSFEQNMNGVTYSLRSRVVGNAGAAGEDAAIVCNEIAWEQLQIFKKAGYTNTRIEMVRVLSDEDGDEYLIERLRPMDAPASSMVVMPRYSRRDINPGINVYDYDREVRKLRPTLLQILLATTIVYTCGSAPGFAVGIMTVVIHRPVNIDNSGALVVMSSIVSCLLTLMIPYSRNKALAFGMAFAGISPKKKYPTF